MVSSQELPGSPVPHPHPHPQFFWALLGEGSAQGWQRYGQGSSA